MSSVNSIPQPPGWPVVGNVFDLDFNLPLRSLCDLADKYGEIYRMRLPGQSLLVVSSQALVDELCDEKRFSKTVQALREMRWGINDGLLTATNEEPNWGIAHRVLMPAFGPASLRNMYQDMRDIANQLVLKWARHGADVPIMITEDFTRLTLDTIALSSMGFRFNSFYHDNLHPFVEAMSSFLAETGTRASRIPAPSWFYREKDRKFAQDIEVLRTTADEVLQARKAEGKSNSRRDLLTAMLHGTDPKTGQKMSDQSILDNLITTLIAGHETTSGMLSFAFYFLIKYPEAYQKARHEVDQVCGTAEVKFEHLAKLPYLDAVFRETLRLQPTIPVFNVAAKQDEILSGQYVIPKHELIIILLAKSHLDPRVYGEDVLEFKPERMMGENFEHLLKEYPNSWKPFGNGSRACIGRPFAWQEALCVAAMILQNFDLELDDPAYQLEIKQTLTTKPKDLRLRARLRDGLTATALERRLAGNASQGMAPEPTTGNSQKVEDKSQRQSMQIYYGSNSGTCQAMAERLASDAASHGFRARIIDVLDNAIGEVQSNEPLVIVVASYEGQAPDNAVKFVHWLESKERHDLQDVPYAVFGCGSREWPSTLHRIPKLVDELFEKHEASRMVSIGLSDVADGHEMTDFQSWENNVLWPWMERKYGTAPSQTPSMRIEISNLRLQTLKQSAEEARVVSNTVLTHNDAPVRKFSMEVETPTSMDYHPGDYITVLPLNPSATIARAMRYFHLSWDAHLTLTAEESSFLPANISVPAAELFRGYVELSQPATKHDILTLAKYAQQADAQTKLQCLAEQAYDAGTTPARLSILDLLESHPSISLPLVSFLAMLPPLRARKYSISSSPLWSSKKAVLTYSLHLPNLVGIHNPAPGVATTYLSTVQAGDCLQVSVHKSHPSFHLPSQPSAATTPIIMIASGTGIAPFRGFVQERYLLKQANRATKLAPAALFFGCRSPTTDDLYRSDFETWEESGAVKVCHAYSRMSPDATSCTSKPSVALDRGMYVQDLLWEKRELVQSLWADGAKIYICGGRKMGQGVKKALIQILWSHDDQAVEKAEVEDERQDEASNWFESLRYTRWTMDVFD